MTAKRSLPTPLCSSAAPRALATRTLVSLVLLLPALAGCGENTAPWGEPASNPAETDVREAAMPLDATPREQRDPKRAARPRDALHDSMARMAPPIEVVPAFDSPAAFVLRDHGVSTFFTNEGFAIAASRQPAERTGPSGWGLHFSLPGAQLVRPRPEAPLRGVTNHLVGAPSAWVTDLPTFGRLVWNDVYRGVDLEVEPRNGGFEYRFSVARGADLHAIRMRWSGALAVRMVDERRAAVDIETGIGTLQEDGLRCYQNVASVERAVPCRYAAVERGPRDLEWDYGFEIGAHDPDLPILIDPKLAWSTFLGGAKGGSYETANAVAADATGNAYVVGTTYAVDFPVVGGFDTKLSGQSDAFVMKIAAAGTSVLWSSFLGGGGDDSANAVAVDATGNAYVVGETWSANLAVPGGFKSTHNGPLCSGNPCGPDGFVAKVNASGSALVWASYLGGGSHDTASGVALDAATNVYVTGTTTSSNFPSTGGFATALNGPEDAFVTKIAANGASMLWSSFLGGTQNDFGYAVAVDATGSAFVVGTTEGGGLPASAGFDPTFNGLSDGFIAKVSPSGSALLWSSYWGGAFFDTGNAVTVDAAGNAYMAGTTSYAGGSVNDACIAKVSPAGALLWTTILGGDHDDQINGIALDATGTVCVAGRTLSTNFPALTLLDTQMSLPNGKAFVAKLLPTTGALLWSALVGGSDGADGHGLAVDGSGNIYVVGQTLSKDFPTTGGFDKTWGGSKSGFISKVSASGSTLLWSSYVGGTAPAADGGNAIAVDAAGHAYVTGHTSSLDFPLVGPFDAVRSGYNDAFVTKFDSSGSSLVWSSYLGGSGDDVGHGIAVDAAENAYVVGSTASTDFPTPGGLYPSYVGTSAAFVTKVSAQGSSLLWSTYLNGTVKDMATAVAVVVDATGNPYVTGFTNSPSTFPVVNGFRTFGTAYVTKFDPSGTSIVWSSVFGGGFLEPTAMALDATNNVYLTGYTNSTALTSAGGFATMLAGGYDAFVAKVNASGKSLAWLSYLGGALDDRGYGVGVDGTGNVYVSGTTNSDDFPTPGGFKTSLFKNGQWDAFITKVSPSGKSLVWSSYLGGQTYNGLSEGGPLAMDASGNPYVHGWNTFTDFPTPNGWDGLPTGGLDTFVTKVLPSGVGVEWSWFLGGSNTELPGGIAVSAAGYVYVTGETGSPDFPLQNPFSSVIGVGSDAYVCRIGGLANATPCASPGDCLSGYCADGVCCSSACAAGPCDACSIAAGASVDGKCAPLTGPACNDGNACTLVDTCTSGVCIGASPVACIALDACHGIGTCDPKNGKCSNPNADGASCDDGNPCTLVDTCQAGACVGASPMVCAPQDGCHSAGTCIPATGLCSNPAKADGVTCSDGNPCTQTDACQAGVCVGTNPLSCFPSDECHAAGVCIAATGLCTNPNAANGSACDDGNPCTQTDACQAGVCTGANPFLCFATDDCHAAGVCDPSTGECSNPSKADGTPCNDWSACTPIDACLAGVCTGKSVTCAPSDQCHAAGACDPATGACSNPAKPDGSACNDGNACTQTDSCQAGACTGSNPVACAAPDQCHTAGACNPATGACSTPAKPDGAACNDGNACTQTDACQAGACTGSNPVACAAPDQCHAAGACNPATGACSNPAKPDGSACNDGNACTQTDSCQAGVCTGTNPVICAVSDQCHTTGACNSATGACSNPVKPDGSACNDGNACTQTDTCQAGTCTGNNPVACAAPDPCHAAGACSPATGACSNPAKPDGSACDDGNSCTQTDSCQAGACTGSNPVACAAPDQCHTAGACNPATGACSTPAKPDGAACNDGNACTQTDACQAGACTGSNPVACAAPDQCHAAGACNPATGACSNPAKPDGSACNDGNACTQTDSCQAGVCTGTNPVICTVSDQCHTTGACNSATGACSNPVKPDGSACNDGNACTQTDTCQAGTCTGNNPVACATPDPCHAAGACNPATGTCSNPSKADGTACNDGNPCTTVDACASGACVGSSPVVCTAQDQCHVAGSCDTITGVCSNPAEADGAVCNDGDACTLSDTCQKGTCHGANPVACSAQDQCHLAGTCNPMTGVCTSPSKPDGAGCDDADGCTQADTCQSGACLGASPVVCAAPDQCHDSGACNPATGMCSNPAKADGAGCDDGNACTQKDACNAGVCTSGAPVVCAPSDECHDAGSCDPASGNCAQVPKAGGTACTGGSCQSGVCVPAQPASGSGGSSGSAQAASSSAQSSSSGGGASSSSAQGSSSGGGASSSSAQGSSSGGGASSSSSAQGSSSSSSQGSSSGGGASTSSSAQGSSSSSAQGSSSGGGSSSSGPSPAIPAGNAPSAHAAPAGGCTFTAGPPTPTAPASGSMAALFAAIGLARASRAQRRADPSRRTA